MPDATGLELIAHELRDRHVDSVVDTNFHRDIATLVVAPDKIIDALRWLKEDPTQAYTFLASVHGSDYFPDAPRFGVHYELLSMERVERLHVKVLLDDPGAPELPQIDSCVELFPTANYQEREIYDMFGIEFRGHPDMTRILMPEDYDGHPQRRDFPIGGEPVIFTYNEYDTPRWWETK